MKRRNLFGLIVGAVLAPFVKAKNQNRDKNWAQLGNGELTYIGDGIRFEGVPTTTDCVTFKNISTATNYEWQSQFGRSPIQQQLPFADYLKAHFPEYIKAVEKLDKKHYG
ncbi:MAG TPA: hypothetical protein ENH82_19040 [bacterium]|nr:hypothetical protein [bacterium]